MNNLIHKDKQTQVSLPVTAEEVATSVLFNFGLPTRRGYFVGGPLTS